MIVQRAAVDEAWGDRQSSDFLKTQGIVGGEELRTMPLFRRARRRLSWLSVNILLNVMAASVIAVFQDTSIRRDRLGRVPADHLGYERLQR